MKAKTLISMMEKEACRKLTCGEFAKIVKGVTKQVNKIIPDSMNAAIAEEMDKQRRAQNERK